MMPWALSWLMNHLWQSTLFVVVVWLAALALRRSGARVRCWLWTAASVKFLVPFSVLVGLGERIQWRTATAAVQPSVALVMEDLVATVSMVAAVAPASHPHGSPVWPWLLLTIWCAGAAAVLFSWWRQWLPIKAALRSATRLRLDAQCAAADLVILSSPSMPEPGAVGIFRPRLLLPEGIVQRLTPTQLQALIAHERCHINCHDNLAAALHMVVEALFWFHPAVWWIEGRLVDERERACDEAVLRSGSRPQDYAEGILEVCRQSAGFRLACVAGVSGSNLRARVEAIMRNDIGRPLTRSQQWAIAAALVAVVGGPLAGGALTAQSQVVVPSSPGFDAATITRSTLYPPGRGPNPALEASIVKRHVNPSPDGRFTTVGPLHALIQAAYDVTRFQVEGGPGWVRSDPFAIEARPAGDATPGRIRGMLQSLLAERFKLTLRRETRTLAIYELVEADGGLKIAAMKEGGCTPPRQIRWDLIDLEAPLYACGVGQRRVLSQSPETRPLPRWPRVTRIDAGGASMSSLIDFISVDLDRVVVDRTGVTALFNIVLDFAPASDPAASGPTIFEALQDQLGLRLRSTSAPIDVLVIESAQQPTQN
jgi:bla regulator protein blaR1